MKIYVLMPLYSSTLVRIKERNYLIEKSKLTPDYSEYFGAENEYYVDLTAKKYEISYWRSARYSGQNTWTWHYSAFDPCDVIKKKANKS